ncbi:MAG: hypothetical protein IPK82_34995 [Polyangiaceae bacterium]|nr:hypothetical protein [Polyangiaceae bacterium]
MGTTCDRGNLSPINIYPGTYSDANGVEPIHIRNDGEKPKVTIRGVEFAGRDFDSLEPVDNTPPENLNLFRLHFGALASCKFAFEMGISVVLNNRECAGVLQVTLTLGDPKPNGALDKEVLVLQLGWEGQSVCSSGKSGWFEDELLEIQGALPQGAFIKSCINCLYSDYSPIGHGLFGTMMCFRNIKEQYLAVRTKDDFFEVQDHHDRMVQETFLCSDFTRRVPGTGYRG